ncbi:hypothetical protein HN51_027481 [Arachis hypogaea]
MGLWIFIASGLFFARFRDWLLRDRERRTVGRWNDALAIRKLMEDRGIKKMPGKSWIESENQKRSHFDLTNMNIAGKHNTL